MEERIEITGLPKNEFMIRSMLEQHISIRAVSYTHLDVYKRQILQLGNNNKLKTSDFAQYEHLAYLNELTAQNAQLGFLFFFCVFACNRRKRKII